MLIEKLLRRKSSNQLLTPIRSMAIALIIVTIPGAAQSRPDPATSFEVASVRPVPAEHGFTSISPSGAARFTARNVSMMVLVELAFGVEGNQILAAPGWFNSALYDVAAKPEGDAGMSYEQLRPLLQQLLKQRFQLAFHREEKDVSGYALVVAKSGTKLNATNEPPASGSILRDGLRSSSVSMRTLAGMLAITQRKPVVDRTGLAGNYDIKLSFAPDGSIDSNLPSIFTAVQEQLGLKLEKQNVPMNFVVIDHMEKLPTEN